MWHSYMPMIRYYININLNGIQLQQKDYFCMLVIAYCSIDGVYLFKAKKYTLCLSLLFLVLFGRGQSSG